MGPGDSRNWVRFSGAYISAFELGFSPKSVNCIYSSNLSFGLAHVPWANSFQLGNCQNWWYYYFPVNKGSLKGKTDCLWLDSFKSDSLTWTWCQKGLSITGLDLIKLANMHCQGLANYSLQNNPGLVLVFVKQRFIATWSCLHATIRAKLGSCNKEVPPAKHNIFSHVYVMQTS